ncbi:endoribonuclease L-PSP [Coriobacterium glomerans PW2]|uniref:Endoribonuclease L-PSP n=1 Tax=Coriobacterium glomerans (strain ATCC 49209 / DSM 20642 / JCM 10262 / PW2) TaxID=700015 RepID=F2NA21_CORGP|nr:Rid family detoxifying hydrolase [Coriobacterium glomerans]AEB06415.1 endoribonuclease L-PSP [Coriobacterium glomerans PW2]
MGKIPNPIGPYSAYRQQGQLTFTSGQLPLDPDTGEIVGKTAYEQTKQSLHNLESVLNCEDSGLDDVVKLTVFVTDIADIAEVNKAFEEVLSLPYPARSGIEVSKLPMSSKVEIEAIAATKA